MQKGKERKMNILKPASKPSKSLKQPNTGRRSFIWKVGAGMSAILAFAVPSMSKPRINRDTGLKAQISRLSNQLGILEDENSLRKLHKAYETCFSNGMYDEVVNLFANDGEVVFNGGIFRGKKKGVRRCIAITSVQV